MISLPPPLCIRRPSIFSILGHVLLYNARIERLRNRVLLYNAQKVQNRDVLYTGGGVGIHYSLMHHRAVVDDDVPLEVNAI